MKLNYYLNDDINCYYCLNVHIMVRTIGLCQALGKVKGRAFGTKVSGDADETSQQRKSKHRLRAAAPVVEDVEHVGHAANEVHDQPQEAIADDVVVDAQDFSGGPHDTSVLMDYAHQSQFEMKRYLFFKIYNIFITNFYSS